MQSMKNNCSKTQCIALNSSQFSQRHGKISSCHMGMILLPLKTHTFGALLSAFVDYFQSIHFDAWDFVRTLIIWSRLYTCMSIWWYLMKLVWTLLTNFKGCTWYWWNVGMTKYFAFHLEKLPNILGWFVSGERA